MESFPNLQFIITLSSITLASSIRVKKEREGHRKTFIVHLNDGD